MLALAGRNPARGGATLRCTLASAGELRVAVHDAAGRVVRVLDGGERPEGVHDLVWDGRDAAGRPVAPGLYLARIVGARTPAVARFVLLR
jgi:flagellar hook assembly protein FlgD